MRKASHLKSSGAPARFLQQDADFEAVVSTMKPLVKQLVKSDRQLAVQWIRKLREELAVHPPSSPLCQQYAQRLLQVVNAGHLTDPFRSPPPSGRLPMIFSRDSTGIGSHDDSLGALEDDSLYMYQHAPVADHAEVTAHQPHDSIAPGFERSNIPGISHRTQTVQAQFPLPSSTLLHRHAQEQQSAVFTTASHPQSSLAPPLSYMASQGLSTHSQSSLEALHQTLRQPPAGDRRQHDPLSTTASTSAAIGVSGNVHSIPAPVTFSSYASLAGTSAPPTMSSLHLASETRTPARHRVVPHAYSGSVSTSPDVRFEPAATQGDYLTSTSAMHRSFGEPTLASALQDCAHLSSEDESLERLLRTAKPPAVDGDNLSSLLSESDSDSVADLLTSIPAVHATSSPKRSIGPSASSGARGSSVAAPDMPVPAGKPLHSTMSSLVHLGAQSTLPLPTHSFQSQTSRVLSTPLITSSSLTSPHGRQPPAHSDVQSLLRTTQLELEKLRVVHRAQASQSEMTSSHLQDQVHQLEKELSAVKQEAATSLDRMRGKQRRKAKSLEEQWQRKVNDIVASCETDKLALQQHQTSGMQQLLEETELRLRRVEEEHSQQAQSMSKTIASLEAKVAKLSDDSEQSNIRYIKLLQEKTSLSTQLQVSQSQGEELAARCQSLEQRHLSDKEAHEASLDAMQQEMDEKVFEARSNASHTVEQLQEHIKQLQQDSSTTKDFLTTTQHQYAIQLQEITSQSQTNEQRLISKHYLEMHSLKTELEQRLGDAQTQLKTSQSLITDREEKIRRLEVDCTRIQEEARLTLDSFKHTVEATSAKTNGEIQKQMSAIKHDLEHSKSARQQQAREFQRQHDMLQQQQQAEILKLQAAFEREKATLIEDHQQQFASQLQERERERESSLARLRSAIAESESQMKTRSDQESEVITRLEEQLQHAREEVAQTVAQCNAQLLDQSHKQADERERASRQVEKTSNRLRSEMSQLRSKLQQDHSTEIDELLAKTNTRLQLLEADYTGKVSTVTKANQRLQREVRQSKSELDELRSRHTQEMDVVESGHSEAVAVLRQQHDGTLESVQQEVDLQRNRVHHLEKKVRHRAMQEEEKIAKLNQQFEDKIRGLLPTAVRQDLEDTISSLKKQVETLEQHTGLLQRQLDSRHSSAGSHSQLLAGESYALPPRSPVGSLITPTMESSDAARLPVFSQHDSSILPMTSSRSSGSKRKPPQWRATDHRRANPLTSTPKRLN